MRRATCLTLLPLAAAAAGAGVWIYRREPPPAPERSALAREIALRHWKVPLAARDDYFKDPARVNAEIRLQPVLGREPDVLEDLRVLSVAPGSPPHAAGLRKGDRVLKVNGTAVSTLKRATDLVNEVRRASTLTVDIERDGNILAFRFDFE